MNKENTTPENGAACGQSTAPCYIDFEDWWRRIGSKNPASEDEAFGNYAKVLARRAWKDSIKGGG